MRGTAWVVSIALVLVPLAGGGLVDQLLYEKFTSAQATYGVNQVVL